ncbi:hypothetical protein F3J20_28700 [Paraburkholderia sp. Cy-641]|uniref:hypothetical protein n=1 Tax=Paraburkholderia sp. Cy-641 TaxID=2608337 RepID=UPI00141F4C0B|nr:hypothetical protein [Paraburkholderia sp. Cy-641]NIF81311.1 hypothetical protein [Paraburkholderia sp. Cy-641]
MSEVQANPSIVRSGPFQTKQEHSLQTDILKDTRHALEAAGFYFSSSAISDANVRTRYDAGVKRMSEMVQDEVNSGRMTVAEGAEFCNTMRNQIMEETRKVTSAWGLARAQGMKGQGISYEAILDRYANRLFSKPFRSLTSEEKDQAYYAAIEAAGRSNAKVNAKTARMRTAGKVGLLVTGALAVWAIAGADDKVTETARQGTILKGGMTGAALASMAVGSICGPGAPFCAIAVLIIGSTAAATVTDIAYDDYLDEVKEFQAWRIR